VTPFGRLIAAILLLVALDGCGTRASGTHRWSGSADIQLGPGINTLPVVEPDEGVRSLVRRLDHASRSIFVETYILSDRSVIHALERAASQSVDVHVLLEPHPLGMGRQPVTVAEQLRAAGVAVRWANPSFALTHAKVMVLDGRLALISTANFSRSGFSADRDFLIWDRNRRDVHAIDTLVRADWDQRGARIAAPNLVVAPATARHKLQRLVSGARRTIEVYGEEMRDRGLEAALERAGCRGVTVRVLLPSVTMVQYEALSHPCVRLRTLDHPYVHAKVILVDGRRGFLGSENMSAQSLDYNREIGVLVRSQAVITLSKVFARDWRRGLPVPAGGR
jgi:phosphatidylserine/phosphatidylglycerophosphate/cardiolipin synthase-like enzyme